MNRQSVPQFTWTPIFTAHCASRRSIPGRSMTDLVNEAVRMAFREDQEDLSAFDERIKEPEITYEALLKDLKAHGKI